MDRPGVLFQNPCFFARIDQTKALPGSTCLTNGSEYELADLPIKSRYLD